MASLPGKALSRALRSVVPRGLLGRSILIILLPLLTLQLVALLLFYGGHLDVISRRLAGGVAGDVAMVAELGPAMEERAFVYDRDEKFAYRYNNELIDINLINGEAMGQYRAFLLDKLSRHAELTEEVGALLARLQRALTQFMLDTHTSEHGYTETYVPFMVNADRRRGPGAFGARYVSGTSYASAYAAFLDVARLEAATGLCLQLATLVGGDGHHGPVGEAAMGNGARAASGARSQAWWK